MIKLINKHLEKKGIEIIEKQNSQKSNDSGCAKKRNDKAARK